MEDKEKHRKRLIVFVSILLSGVVLVVAGELLVRILFPFKTPDTLKESSLQYLPSIFSRHRLNPRQEVKTAGPRFRFFSNKKRTPHPQVKYFINNIGYRGADVALVKPKNVTRIVFLGGSSVFDIWAMAEKNAHQRNMDWPHQVETILNNQSNQKYEVINAGIPGHATFDSLGRLYSQIWVYNPDYVVLYNGWNDIKYFIDLKPETPLIALFDPYDSLKNPYTNYFGAWDQFLSHSQLYIKLRNRYLALTTKIGGEGIIRDGAYTDQYSPYALKQFKLNVELFVDTCHNIGAIPILLTQATLVVSRNSKEEKDLIKYSYVKLTHEALVRAFDDIYRIIRQVAHEKDVAMLDLAKQLNGRVELFTDGVHTTPKGSQEIAETVAGFLLKQ